eukprot:663451-Pleurochrysis_carterae.AAC.1
MQSSECASGFAESEHRRARRHAASRPGLSTRGCEKKKAARMGSDLSRTSGGVRAPATPVRAVPPSALDAEARSAATRTQGMSAVHRTNMIRGRGEGCVICS